MAIYKWYYLQDGSYWSFQCTGWKLSLSSCGRLNGHSTRLYFHWVKHKAAGSTEDATPPIIIDGGYGGYYGNNNCQYVDSSAKSVWFTLVGDGACYTTSTGSSSEIIATVLRGTQCGSLVCLGQSDIYNQNDFTWETEIGETYYILVGGIRGNAGSFVLDIGVSDCGPSCHQM
jgi:hypothetical protein